MFISKVATRDEALRAVAEIHCLAVRRDPASPFGGVRGEVLRCGEEALEAAVVLGYIEPVMAGKIPCLRTTGTGREALRRAEISWTRRAWGALTLERRTMAGWGRRFGIMVIDPDGFDRRDPRLYRRPMAREEFLAGLPACTVEFDPARLERGLERGEWGAVFLGRSRNAYRKVNEIIASITVSGIRESLRGIVVGLIESFKGVHNGRRRERR